MHLMFFLVCFGASVIGAICGIGGGIIIKPALDAFGMISVPAASFLSGCTVLSMTGYTVVRSRMEGSKNIDTRIGTQLAIGAAFGGIIGKVLFDGLLSVLSDKELAGAIQAACLLVITAGTLTYTVNRVKIRSYHMAGSVECLLIGGTLGILSSFLGIGGGPVNLVVLYHFFSMSTKIAAENSLYIILFSQIMSLVSTLCIGTVPEIRLDLLLLMVLAGITGGILGRKINQRVTASMVDKLFVCLMLVLIGINIYNLWSFLY